MKTKICSVGECMIEIANTKNNIFQQSFFILDSGFQVQGFEPPKGASVSGVGGLGSGVGSGGL